MSETKQTCPASEQISALIDGDLEASVASALTTHLKGCTSCGQQHADLLAMRGALPTLAEVEPRPELWRQIAHRHEEQRRPAALVWLRRWWPAPALGLAGASALVLLTFGGPDPAVEPELVAGPELVHSQTTAAGAERAMAAVRQAEQHYIDAIAELEQVVDLDHAAPRPEARQQLERGLAEIDRSIRRCRRALHDAPEDMTAQEIMLAAYQQKVDFLGELLPSAAAERRSR